MLVKPPSSCKSGVEFGQYVAISVNPLFNGSSQSLNLEFGDVELFPVQERENLP